MKTECIYELSCLLSRDENTTIVSIVEKCLQYDERVRYKWKGNIKMDLKEVYCHDVNSTQLCYVECNVVWVYKPNM
jgi:hypothetical protein